MTNSTTDNYADLTSGFDPLVQEEYMAELEEFLNTDETQLRVYKMQRITGTLSLLGSLFILQDILRSKAKRNRMSHRIMIALSSMDVLFSFFGPVLGTLPAPRGMAFGAMGSYSLCAVAGYLSDLGFFCSTMYNGALAVCYLLMVRFGWHEDKFRRWWVQGLFLVVTPLNYVVLLNVSAAMKANNFMGISCSAFCPSPLGCDNKTIQCTRGSLFRDTFLQWSPAVNTALICHGSVICVPIVIVSMGALCDHVFQTERASERYRFERSVSTTVMELATLPMTPTSAPRRTETQTTQVAMQGICYLLSVLAVEVPWTCWVLAFLAKGKRPEGPLHLAAACLIPLQVIECCCGWFCLHLLSLRSMHAPHTCSASILTGILQQFGVSPAGFFGIYAQALSGWVQFEITVSVEA